MVSRDLTVTGPFATSEYRRKTYTSIVLTSLSPFRLRSTGRTRVGVRVLDPELSTHVGGGLGLLRTEVESGVGVRRSFYPGKERVTRTLTSYLVSTGVPGVPTLRDTLGRDRGNYSRPSPCDTPGKGLSVYSTLKLEGG